MPLAGDGEGSELRDGQVVLLTECGGVKEGKCVKILGIGTTVTRRRKIPLRK